MHICELAQGRVAKTTDVVKQGDSVKVKVIGFDDRGKVKLSMRVVDQDTGEDITEKVGAKPGRGERDRGERRDRFEGTREAEQPVVGGDRCNQLPLPSREGAGGGGAPAASWPSDPAIRCGTDATRAVWQDSLSSKNNRRNGCVTRPMGGRGQ